MPRMGDPQPWMKEREMHGAPWWQCCDHCGCQPDDRLGHDDTCSHGCNDKT